MKNLLAPIVVPNIATVDFQDIINKVCAESYYDDKFNCWCIQDVILTKFLCELFFKCFNINDMGANNCPVEGAFDFLERAKIIKRIPESLLGLSLRVDNEIILEYYRDLCD